MEKPTIVLKVKAKHFGALLALAESVYEHLNGNIHFVSPSPSLPVLNAGISQLTITIAKWGPRSNRGSYAGYVNLQSTAIYMHSILKRLALYCESTVRMNVPAGEQESAVSSSGFALKKQKSPQGRLEIVQNLHHFIARNVRPGHIKLRWEQPLNVSTHTNVRTYVVYRNTSNDFATATRITTVTETTVTDAPGAGAWFYWITPLNYMGEGVLSHAVMVRTV